MARAKPTPEEMAAKLGLAPPAEDGPLSAPAPASPGDAGGRTPSGDAEGGADAAGAEGGRPLGRARGRMPRSCSAPAKADASRLQAGSGVKRLHVELCASQMRKLKLLAVERDCAVCDIVREWVDSL